MTENIQVLDWGETELTEWNPARHTRRSSPTSTWLYTLHTESAAAAAQIWSISFLACITQNAMNMCSQSHWVALFVLKILSDENVQTLRNYEWLPAQDLHQTSQSAFQNGQGRGPQFSPGHTVQWMALPWCTSDNTNWTQWVIKDDVK